MRPLAGLLLAAALVLALGCGGSNRRLGQPCTNTSECGGGLICLNQRCVALVVDDASGDLTSDLTDASSGVDQPTGAEESQTPTPDTVDLITAPDLSSDMTAPDLSSDAPTGSDGADGTDSTLACVPNSVDCVADTQRKCNANGQWEAQGDCGGNGCNAAGTQCNVCKPNTTSCEGDMLATCKSDGSGTTQSSCPFGCDAGACQPCSSPPLALTQLFSGGYHSCGLDAQGALWCWGFHSNGELAIVSSGPPYYLNWATRTDDGPWLKLAVGINHTCGIKTDNTLWCWGRNFHGALGIGKTEAEYANTFVPQQVMIGTFWKQVTAGERHNCAIAMDDSLWCWGANAWGQLGIVGGDLTAPAKVPNPQASDQWLSISSTAQSKSTCGIKSDNTLWCWGLNQWNNLGLGAIQSTDTPTQVVGYGTDKWKQIDTGWTTSCGIQSDDTAWCMGNNPWGELGNGSTTTSGLPNPPQPVGPTPDCPSVTPNTWKLIRAGSCGIRSDDTIWCWGSGGNGNRWLSENANPCPVKVDTSLYSNVVFSGGGTIALRQDGTLLCAGVNDYSGCALGHRDPVLTPTPMIQQCQ